MCCLFAALVDLAEEGFENLLLQSLRLVDGRNFRLELADNLLLVLLVHPFQVQFAEELLDLGLEFTVLAAICSVEHLALLGVATLQGLVYQPRTLVILDIRSNLSNNFGVAVSVKVVVLNLEVLAERDEDVVGLAEVLGGSKLEVVEGQGNREIEAVVGGLVGDNEHILLHGEVVEVDLVFGRGDQVAQLAQLSLPGGLVEQFNQVDVGRVGAELFLEDDIDTGLEEEGVVNGDQTDTLVTIPAGLATAGD